MSELAVSVEGHLECNFVLEAHVRMRANLIGQGLGDGSPDPWESAFLTARGLPADLFRASVPALGATGAASGALDLARGAWHAREVSRIKGEEEATIWIWSHDPISDGQQPATAKRVEIVLRPGDEGTDHEG